jgi:pimeloyl-ACP methyl ester carboxylesterase
LLHFLSAVARHDVRTELALVRAPTLLLHGELDAIVGRESQATLLTGIPHAQLFELAGAGHNLVEEAAEPSARSTLDFLRTPGI